MTAPLFGTDGIRAAFGDFPLRREPVRRLGALLGERLRRSGATPSAVLAGDTRDSTPILCGWLVEGLAGAGVRCRVGGVLPTPAVSRLVGLLGAGLGVAISASHNLHPDNGIKLVDAAGGKWTARDEAELEAALRAGLPDRDAGGAPEAGASWPDLDVDPDLAERYLDGLAATLPRAALAGLAIDVDTGHGAASPFAARLLARLGAAARVIHDRPDGTNINRDCGSTHPEVVARAVVAAGGDLGVTLDGDADRALLADERGGVRDGDAMLFLWATSLLERGHLDPPVVVATSMSNLGLERALARHGVRVERCDVGDRQVVEALRRTGARLGGEQSGHLVATDLSRTGDGLLTAIHLAAIVARAGRPLSDLLRGFERYPQLLRNVRVPRKAPLASMPRLAAARRDAERALGDDGRLVIRYSGTEPLLRLMLEGPDRGLIEELAARLEAATRDDLAG